MLVLTRKRGEKIVIGPDIWLTVLEVRGDSIRFGSLCECGERLTVRGAQLPYGKTRSCGCLRRLACISRCRSHDGCGTPEYITWSGIVRRCENIKDKSYPYYGGRGITICEWWRNSFANFLADMGPKPSAKHTIERINNQGDYEPDNCRWATRQEQARNCRKNRLLTYKGVTKCVAEWAEVVGINARTLNNRLNKYGWPPERVLETPYGGMPR